MNELEILARLGEFGALAVIVYTKLTGIEKETRKGFADLAAVLRSDLQARVAGEERGERLARIEAKLDQAVKPGPLKSVQRA